jgi:hypothetical protein
MSEEKGDPRAELSYDAALLAEATGFSAMMGKHRASPLDASLTFAMMVVLLVRMDRRLEAIETELARNG